MPTYIAFLRAINLGAKRKFGKDDLRAAVEATGATDVETYINTGNVRLTTGARSTAKVEQTLEKAFLADRGFEVPTIVFTPAQLVEVAESADRLVGELGQPASHYITLLREEPTHAAIEAAHAAEAPGERLYVDGRAAHLLIHRGYHESRLAGSRVLGALGVGTARNVNVVRTLAQRWGS